jgi:hypothetical protein
MRGRRAFTAEHYPRTFDLCDYRSQRCHVFNWLKAHLDFGRGGNPLLESVAANGCFEM